MRWYLPDCWPIYWNELRRMLGRFHGFSLRTQDEVIGLQGLLLPLAVLGGFFLLASYCGGERLRDDWLFARVLVGYAVAFSLCCPLLTAGAFAHEREKGALEFLLILPVSTIGLILQKLASRATALAMLFCISLPFVVTAVFRVHFTPSLVPSVFRLVLAIAASCLTLGFLTSSLASSSRLALVVTYAPLVAAACVQLIYLQKVVTPEMRGLTIMQEQDITRIAAALDHLSLIHAILAAMLLGATIYSINRLRHPSE